MSCTHSQTCALLPNLRNSLQGWRTHYCDTVSAWRECARYQMSLTGTEPPLALLPNGKVIGALDAGEGRSVETVAVPLRDNSAVRIAEPAEAGNDTAATVLDHAGAATEPRSRFGFLLSWRRR